MAEGIIEYFDDNHVIAKSKNVYECVDYIRDMKIDDNKVYDKLEIKSFEELESDYVFYCKGKCVIDYNYEEVQSIGDKEGYQHLFDIKRLTTKNLLLLSLIWQKLSMLLWPGRRVGCVCGKLCQQFQ